MWKFKRVLKTLILSGLLITTITAVVTISAVSLLSKISAEIFTLLGPLTVITLFTAIILKFIKGSDKHINKYGYVVLTPSNELEHRHIAIQLLGRSLRYNEIVHHINGKKTDNHVRNLCVMDGHKHELFHSWLSWKKRKSGKYPPFSDQKRVLVNEYGGILLEAVNPMAARKVLITKDPTFSKNLFDQLRIERQRLAEEKNVPLYMIFDNRTLQQMAELAPHTHDKFAKIRGVGPAKLEMYGEQFLSVIKRHRSG